MDMDTAQDRDRQEQDDIDAMVRPSPYLREWEQAAGVMKADAGLCSRDRKPLTLWRFHWSDDAPFTTTRGQVNHTQVFDNYRHTDGTLCDEARPDLYYCYPLPTCSKCGALDQFTVVQEAWGDRTTCDACGDEHWFSIGD